MQWTEKYRPKTLDDIASHNEVKSLLWNAQETGNLPHLLFHGPPGTGKTSMILAYCHSIFPGKLFNSRVMELNASDDRGINVVREQITTFSKKAINNVYPPYKIIILDEVDAMTSDAQSALRKIIEEFSSITRFCLICNYINNIISPIISRCVCFRFLPIDKRSTMNKLQEICVQEEIGISNNIIEEIIDISEGDLRKSITFLQNIRYDLLCGSTIDEVIQENLMMMPDELLEQIKDIILGHNCDIEDIMRLARHIIRMGYDDDNILASITLLIINMDEIDDIRKSGSIMYISEIANKMKLRTNRFIQILGLLNKLSYNFEGGFQDYRL